jgi:uncharacterized YccA/Bax inhibitor family protein
MMPPASFKEPFMFRSGNPALKVFERPQTIPGFGQASKTMTVAGTVNAAFILVSLCAASAIVSWTMLTSKGSAQVATPVLVGSAILSLISYFVIWLAPRSAPIMAPIYAVTKGVVLGSTSLIVAAQVGGSAGPATGIVFQAIILTFGIAFSLLVGYKTGIIRIGSTVKRCMCAAVGGIVLYCLAGLLLPLAGVQMPLFYEMFGWGKTGMIGIAFSGFMLVLASLFLVLDFQDIEAGAESGAPKYMEWYAAWGLLVTLVWIYLEALRLLSKLRSK